MCMYKKARLLNHLADTKKNTSQAMVSKTLANGILMHSRIQDSTK